MKSKGVKNMGVSSITPQFGLKDKIYDVNSSLKELCQEMNFSYIDNYEIKYGQHLTKKDYIHLNFDGVRILEGNFAKFLKSCEEKE